MPIKLGPRINAETEARIEIIPLIDIMFFLLASFMLVSLSMVNLTAVKINLPKSSTATLDAKRVHVSITVDKGGLTFFDKQPIGANELAQRLVACRQTNENVFIIISGDMEARHGNIIRVLDIVRSAGIEKVAFQTSSSSTSTTPSP